MRLTNDEVFNYMLKEEFDKIPFIFRFSKLRTKIAVSVLIVLLIAMCIFSFAVNGTQGLPALVVAAVLTALVAAWMTLGKVFENRAFKKASNFTFKYSVADRQRYASIMEDIRIKSMD